MKARVVWGTLALLSGGILADAARAECNCLYNGQRFEQEDTVCMRTPQGLRMARCGMLENIAWWEMLDAPCPGQISALSQPNTGAATLSTTRPMTGTPARR